MGRGEIPAARGIEQILDSVVVEKESVAASTGEERVGAGLDDVGVGTEGDLGIGYDLGPNSFDRAGFRAPFATKTFTVCIPFCGCENT